MAREDAKAELIQIRLVHRGILDHHGLIIRRLDALDQLGTGLQENATVRVAHRFPGEFDIISGNRLAV